MREGVGVYVGGDSHHRQGVGLLGQVEMVLHHRLGHGAVLEADQPLALVLADGTGQEVERNPHHLLVVTVVERQQLRQRWMMGRALAAESRAIGMDDHFLEDGIVDEFRRRCDHVGAIGPQSGGAGEGIGGVVVEVDVHPTMPPRCLVRVDSG